MRLKVLGPLEVTIDGQPVPLPAGKPRTLLGVLACQANTTVSTDRLMNALWGEQPPRTARNNLHVYVLQLRRALDDPRRIERTATGYALRIPPDAVDTEEFETLAELGRAALAGGDAATARGLLCQALRLWQGPAYAGLADVEPLRHEAARLAERRTTVLGTRIEADLALGRYSELVAELGKLVTDEPLRERWRAQLMTALYRAGRQAEALQVYRETRKLLADELGVEPGADLQRLHTAILRGESISDPADGRARALRVRPALLPSAVAGFAGRRGELACLDALLEAVAGAPTAAIVCVLSGTAGVGKTSLALRWAHSVAQRFPDGQLYVNLRGFDPGGRVTSADDAVLGFLDALGIPVDRVPADRNARFGLYRSGLAGKRILLVLDNARDAEQVRPLLPGSPTAFVVVTSRNQLTGLVAAEGARPLTVDLLSTEEAEELLARRLGADRLRSEPDAVERIIAACAKLPLPLAIAAARAEQTGFPLETIAAELDKTEHRLDALDTGDPASQVRAVFSWSYAALTSSAGRLFRLLGLHVGPDIGLSAAASLAGLPVAQTRQLLAELARAHLVAEPRSGRYACHDLLRVYAAECAGATDPEECRHAALHRLLDHYVHTGYAATRLLEPQRRPIPLERAIAGVSLEPFADVAAAREWFAAERPALLAATERAGQRGFGAHAWQLAWATANFLDRQGRWPDLAASQEVALAAARGLDDRLGQAVAHRALGRAKLRLGQVDEARAHLCGALRLFTELGDHIAEAYTLHHLARLAEQQGRHADGLRHARRALELHCATGHRPGQADALNLVGWFHALLGDYPRTFAYCQQALETGQDLAFGYVEAEAWRSLGYAHHQLRQYDRAVVCFERALVRIEPTGERFGEAHILANLGDTHHAAGNAEAARVAWRRGLRILNDINHPDAAIVRTRLHETCPEQVNE